MSVGTSRFLKIHPDAIIPTYGSRVSAGCDLYLLEDVVVSSAQSPDNNAGQVVLARTGIVAIPPFGTHYELAIRSSIPVKYPGIILANGVGVIDEDYSSEHDEIKIALYNTLPYPASYRFAKGQRIAQLLLCENARPEIREMTLEEHRKLRKIERGGFGSTGE